MPMSPENKAKIEAIREVCELGKLYEIGDVLQWQIDDADVVKLLASLGDPSSISELEES